MIEHRLALICAVLFGGALFACADEGSGSDPVGNDPLQELVEAAPGDSYWRCSGSGMTYRYYDCNNHFDTTDMYSIVAEGEGKISDADKCCVQGCASTCDFVDMTHTCSSGESYAFYDCKARADTAPFTDLPDSQKCCVQGCSGTCALPEAHVSAGTWWCENVIFWGVNKAADAFAGEMECWQIAAAIDTECLPLIITTVGEASPYCVALDFAITGACGAITNVLFDTVFASEEEQRDAFCRALGF